MWPLLWILCLPFVYSGKEIQEAFLVKIMGCTGSLITPDWFITAAHCFSERVLRTMSTSITISQIGDSIYNLRQRTLKVEKHTGYNGDNTTWWNLPWIFESSKVTPENKKYEFWRYAHKIIIHHKYEGEELSWKGFDFSLVKLGREVYLPLPLNSVVIPICLISSLDNEDLFSSRHHYFVAGYGRRFIPHCFTNSKGPEKFAVCGRPLECSHTHRTERCGLEFLYQDKIHRQCLYSPTPSSHDPECMQIRKIHDNLQNSEDTIHIFSQNNSFLTTCYSHKPLAESRGWCVTRDSFSDLNVEPSYTSGWGFCTNETNQHDCNSDNRLINKWNITARRIDIFGGSLCEDKLQKNIEVEQPGTLRAQYDPLIQFGIFCSGQNHTYSTTQDVFAIKTNNGKYHFISENASLRSILLKEGKILNHYINGGPSCFGDSGGPLWRINSKSPPTLVGVYSFMLWGTCIGRDEPSYYGRVKNFLPWIYFYVPKKQICTG